jgi:hypothetical protein
MDPHYRAVDRDESIRRDAFCLGFRPAFLHIPTFSIHSSLDGDGRPDSPHVLAGFERNGFFYTAAAVARAAAEWPCTP